MTRPTKVGLYFRGLLIGHRRLPRKCRHDDGGLLQLILAHALRVVGVGVAMAIWT